MPDDFIEAARIDGATEWTIYWKVIVPILRPVLAALAVLEFLAMWNNYLWPQVMASTPRCRALDGCVADLWSSVLGIVPLHGTIMAGNMLATIPLVLLFHQVPGHVHAGRRLRCRVTQHYLTSDRPADMLRARPRRVQR